MVNTVKNVLITLHNLQQMQLKLLQKKVIQKTAEATADVNDNKVANRITNVSRSSLQNKPERITLT